MKNIDKKKHKNLILFLKTIFKNNIIILIVIFFSMILTALLNSLLPVILQYIIDSIINNKNIKLLVTLSIIYLIISIFISLLNIWKETKISCFQKKIGVKFKLKMLKKLSTFSGKYYSNLKTGEMINLFENDCDIIANNGITIWFELTSNIVMSILSLYFLFRIQKKILLFVLILQMIIIWTQLVFTRKIANGTKIIREEYGHIYDFVQQYISNIIQVIICKTKKYFFTRYTPLYNFWVALLQPKTFCFNRLMTRFIFKSFSSVLTKLTKIICSCIFSLMKNRNSWTLCS